MTNGDSLTLSKMDPVRLWREELFAFLGKLGSIGEDRELELVVKTGEGGSRGMSVKLKGSESDD